VEQVHAKRLLKLADFLEKLPRKRFDYGNWIGDDWKGKADLSCGTTACALGWACAMPAFRRLGAGFCNDQSSDNYTSTTLHGEPVWPDKVSYHLFGLTKLEHDRLFEGGGGLPWDATPKQAAKFIRAYVKEQQASPHVIDAEVTFPWVVRIVVDDGRREWRRQDGKFVEVSPATSAGKTDT